MANSGGWKEKVITYAPVVSLLLGFLTVVGSAPKIGNPAVWWIALTTLPTLILIGTALWKIARGQGPATSGQSQPGAEPNTAPPSNP